MGRACAIVIVAALSAGWAIAQQPEEATCDSQSGRDECPSLVQAAPGNINVATGPSIAFVHVPKTAGTSLNHGLRLIGSNTGRKVFEGKWWPQAMDEQVNAVKKSQRPSMVVGEFTGNAYGALLGWKRKMHADVHLWTMLRNPVLRAMSQAWHLERLQHFTKITANSSSRGDAGHAHADPSYLVEITPAEKATASSTNIMANSSSSGHAGHVHADPDTLVEKTAAVKEDRASKPELVEKAAGIGHTVRTLGFPNLFSRNHCRLSEKDLCGQGREGWGTCLAKCYSGGQIDCCGRFQSYQTRVLGQTFHGLSVANTTGLTQIEQQVMDSASEAKTGSDAFRVGEYGLSRSGFVHVQAEQSVPRSLLVTKSRIDNGILQVGIAEFFQASICLILHESLEGESGARSLFDKCCIEPNADAKSCPLMSESNVHATDRSFYQRKYLMDEAAQSEILESNKEDCELYAYSLKLFVGRVRAMEEEMDVNVLDKEITPKWSCESWIADYLAPKAS